MFKVQQRMCKTCIYRSSSPLNIVKLENDVRDNYGGFRGFRICHHSHDVCCRGFWARHKNKFAAGQIAQRLNLVQFVDIDINEGNGTERKYACPICGRLYDSPEDAAWCAKKHTA